MNTGINRIRLEFKAPHTPDTSEIPSCVLIESDWNLKYKNDDCNSYGSWCINRIRLEFKGHQDEAAHDDAPEY